MEVGVLTLQTNELSRYNAISLDAARLSDYEFHSIDFRKYAEEHAVKIHQLSLFLENKPGHLRSVVDILADAGINIVTLSLADTQQFGILRLVLEDWQKAKSVLEETGCVVNVTEVVATEVEDRPGGLSAILRAVGEGGVNVEYMYAFTFGKNQRAVMVFRFDEPDQAIQILQDAGISVLGGVELFSRTS